MLRHNPRGDTIVEVLICLAILALVFSISYATASRALEESQNSQEHSTALEYIDTQLEALHYESQNQAIAASYWNPNNSFYLEPAAPSATPPVQSINIVNTGINGFSITGNGFDYQTCIISPNSNPSTTCKACSNNVTTPSMNVFTVCISWPGIGDLGTQSESLSYRIYPPL